MIYALRGLIMRCYVLLLMSGALLAGCDQVAQMAADDQNQVLHPPVGRFTIVHSPHVRRDTMLLDTATGVTWLWVSQTSGASSSANEGMGTWQQIEMADPLPRISN